MAIKEKVTNTTRLTYFEGEIPISHRYTYGLAGERFFRGLMDGKLLASVAEKSGTVYCPPRIFCEDSFEAIERFIELPGTGEVESFTICCEDLHGEPMAPLLIAFVRFDGSDGGMALPLKCDPEDAFIGMDVQLQFVPKKQRKGHLSDVFLVPLGG